MLILFFFIFIYVLNLCFPFTEALLHQGDKAQQICLDIVQNNGPHPELKNSLICGQSLPQGSYRFGFQQLGIVHLFVVSGFHLNFVRSWLIRFIPHRSWLVSLFLLAYAIICSLNPPVVRAFLQSLLSDANKEFKFYWSEGQNTFLTGVLCLSLFPQWLNSISFLLSWIAGLSLKIAIHSSSKGPLQALKINFVLYLLLIPLVFEFQVLSPLSIVINWIITPVFSFWLFPLTLINGLFGSLEPIYNFSWTLLLEFGQDFSSQVSQEQQWSKKTLLFKWLYLTSLHLLLSRLEFWQNEDL